MSKKRTAKQLEKLFEGVVPEETTPQVKIDQPRSKTPAPIQRSESRQEQAGRPTRREPASTPIPKMTGALPSLESQLFTGGGQGAPARLSLAFPIEAQKWATLQIEDQNTKRTWDDDEKLLVKQVTDQLSLALENARLFQQTQQQATELAILNDMGRELASQLDLSGVGDVVLKFTARLMDTTNFFINLYDEESQTIKHVVIINDGERVEPHVRPFGKGLTEYVLQTRRPLYIPDRGPERMKELGIDLIPLGDSRPPLSWLGVPLTIGTRVLGVIAVQSVTTNGMYTQRHHDLLTAIGSQAAIAFENARLFQQSELRAQELAVLNELGRSLASSYNIDQVLEEIYRGVIRLVKTTNFYVGLFDAEKNEISFRLNVTESELDREIVTLPADQGITSYVINQRQAFMIRENLGEWLAERKIEPKGELPKCWLGAPILFGDQVIGAMSVQDFQNAFAYNEHDRELLIAIANQASTAINNVSLLEQIQKQANELAILNEMGRELSAVLDVNTSCETIHKFTTQLMNADDFFIALYDESEKKISFPYATSSMERYEPPARQVGNGMTDYIIKSNRPLFLPDNITDRMQELGVEMVLVGNNLPAQCWMGAPLSIGEKVTGAIVVQSTTKPRLYNQHHFDLLNTIASQAAISLENARLFVSEQRRASELNTLVELSRLVSENMDLEEIYATAHHIIGRVMTTDAFFISLYEQGTNQFINAYDIDNGIRLEPKYYPVDQGFTGYVIRLGSSYLAKDLFADPGPFKRVADADGQYKSPRSVIATPLHFSNQIVGVISAQSYAANTYSQNDLRLLESFADTIAIGVQNARLFQQTELRAEEMGVLNDLGRVLSAQLDAGQVLEETYRGVARLMDASNFFIGVYDPEKNVVDFPINVTESEVDKEIVTIPANEGMTGYVFKTRTPLLLKKNVKQWLTENHIRSVGENPASWLGVPLLVGNQFLGLMAVQSLTKENVYNEHERDLLMAFGNQAAIALQNARLFQQTEHRAEIDRLTGEISNIFASIDPLEFRSGVNQALGKLGQFTGVDRTYIFLLDEDSSSMNCSNEWCAEGVSSHTKDLQNIPVSTFPYLMKKLNSGEIFYTPKVSILPKEAKKEKAEFEREAIKSVICVPMFDRGKLIGFQGFDSVRVERVWGTEEQNLLRLTGDIFVTALNRKNASEALSKSEAELRALFNSMTDVIIVYDKDGRYVRIAPTNPSRLIKPSDEMIGKRITEVLPVETHAPFMDIIHQTLNTGETHKLEYPMEIGSQTYWFDASVSRLTEDQVFWISRDITERKIAEESIRRQNEYLATAAEIGRLITSTLDLNLLFSRAVNLINERFGFYHAAIFIIEETGFNAIMREGTGEAGKEMKEHKHALAVGSKSIIGKVTESGEPLIINNTALEPTHRPNPLLPETRAEAGIPLRVSNRIVGAVDIQSTQVDAFTGDNIAVLQILADQIAVAIDNARSYDLAQQAVKEMREVDRFKSQFLANMSHELRTPLNSIIGFSRVILKGIDGPISELQHQDLNAIYNSGQHLLGLINDILDLSRIEAGKMELTFDEVNIGETINSVMSTITGLIKDRPITLKKVLPPELPPIRADAMRIRQVLLNLMSNAAKFTEEGTITVEAAIKTSPSGHPEIMIGVTDSGPGISPEDQTKLFQPFSQVDSSPTRKTGGSGLGLSISQHLVQMHGGRIGLHSTVGKGSTFYFTLPVYRGQDTPGTTNKVILAIDDDIQVTSLYERFLQPQGYQVVSLTDPSKAVDRVRQLKPFAVTLDIMMPGYDGWQVIKDLKEHADTRNVPVVICSIVEEEEKGFSLGASDYLLKPILEDDLLNALNRLNSDGSIREVLVVDDDADDLRLIGKILSEDGRYKPVLAEGGKRGWEAITTNPPHAVVLDLFMADLDGFSILERLRESEKYRQIPVLVVTGGDLTVEQREQLAAFGQRLIQKGTLTENELLTTLENALKRVTPK